MKRTLRLAVGFRRIGLRPDVPEAELATCIPEGEGFVAGAVVSHDPLHDDSEACVVGDADLEEGDGALLFLVGSLDRSSRPHRLNRPTPDPVVVQVEWCAPRLTPLERKRCAEHTSHLMVR